MHACIAACSLALLLAISFHTTETRRESAAFDSLERALREVLNAISCQELPAIELEDLLLNSPVTIDTKVKLRSLEIPDKDDCKATQLLHFLDFRRNGSNPRCMLNAFPRLRLIPNPSGTPIFPAHFMDWQCSSECVEVFAGPGETNYELLERLDTCSNNTADWRYREATNSHPVNPTTRCVCRV